MCSKSWKVAILISAVCLLACSPVEVKTYPSPTPTQSLNLASNYVAGLSELPSDHLLFVLAKSENSGAGICNFPVVEQTPLAFRYSSGVLEISSSGSTGWLSDDSLLDVYQPKIMGLGFFGYLTSDNSSLGGGIHDEIYYVDQLPYRVSSFSLVIYSVLKDGTIVAGIDDQVYQVEPNQHWIQVSSYAPEEQPDCQIANVFSIANYGILKRSDVKFVDEPILP
jgi:hypothetical protein